MGRNTICHPLRVGRPVRGCKCESIIRASVYRVYLHQMCVLGNIRTRTPTELVTKGKLHGYTDKVDQDRLLVNISCVKFVRQPEDLSSAFVRRQYQILCCQASYQVLKQRTIYILCDLLFLNKNNRCCHKLQIAKKHQNNHIQSRCFYYFFKQLMVNSFAIST